METRTYIFETACPDRHHFALKVCEHFKMNYEAEYNDRKCKKYRVTVEACGAAQNKLMNRLAAAVTAHPGEMEARRDLERSMEIHKIRSKED